MKTILSSFLIILVLHCNAQQQNTKSDTGIYSTPNTLIGRKMIVPPKILNESLDTGIVVLRIKVDRGGNVTSAEGPITGSTSNADSLLVIAKKAVLKCKFTPAPNAPVEQSGTIKIKFTIRKNP